MRNKGIWHSVRQEEVVIFSTLTSRFHKVMGVLSLSCLKQEEQGKGAGSSGRRVWEQGSTMCGE